jgi:putrescine transport system permease protein
MQRIFSRLPGRSVVIGVPFTWLGVFFFLPFCILLYISFVDMGGDIHPFKPIWDPQTGILSLKYENYWSIFRTGEGGQLFKTLYVEAYARSVWYALWTAVLCLVIGYPFAYFIARSPASVRPALLMMVMLPFWTSFLLRIYAWKILLADSGVFNQILLALGVITEPIKMMNTPFSLILGMVYCYIPFMILPLYATLVKMDLSLLEAALDLGATPAQAFWRITVPLSKSGIIAGSMLVFIPCVGEFVIPELLGGPQTLMIGRVLWDEFFGNNDWPMAAAVAVVMVLLIIVPLALFNKHQAESNAQAAA